MAACRSAAARFFWWVGGVGSQGPATAPESSWRPRAGGIPGVAKPVGLGSAAGGQAWGRAGAELEAQGRWHPGRGQAGGLGSAAGGPTPAAGLGGQACGSAGARQAAYGRRHPGHGQVGEPWQRSCWPSTKHWPRWTGQRPCLC